MGIWNTLVNSIGGGVGTTANAAGASGDPSDWANKNLKNLGNPLQRTSDSGPSDPANFQLQGQDARRDSLLQQADFAAGRRAPQIGQSGFRQNQQGLMGMLEARARGEGPSAAQMQLKDAMGKNVSSQQALLATGGGPGAARMASQQAGAIGGSLAGQGAQLRAQEMTQAQGMLGQFAGQARGQDLQRQGMISDAELRSRGMNDQQIARMRQMELDNARLGLQGSMGQAADATSRRGQDLGTPTGLESLLSAGGAALSLA